MSRQYTKALVRQETQALTRELKTQGTILGGFVAVMWILEIVDIVLGGALNSYGVRPHQLIGLRGILFAPFLHGGLGHLIANTDTLPCPGLVCHVARNQRLLCGYWDNNAS
jgi:membrane associated rhomboid family serine protease